jgi:hypothetical protein
MLKKHGKFLADWRNEFGKRLRKAFPTKKGAAAHQVKMRALAQSKKAPVRAAASRKRRRTGSRSGRRNA